MCGRYALYGPMSRLREAMLLDECPEYGERYNIAPQASILVVRYKPGTGRVGQMARWGLVPAWAKDPAIGARLNNARGETVAEKPAFRSSFARHRCLIPANGFYEWQAVDTDGHARKQPWYIHPSEPGGFFAFAGLLALWKAPDGSAIISTCIITTGPNELMADIHERMPVILRPEHFAAWLDPTNQDVAALTLLLQPLAAERMSAYPVSPSINSGRAEGPKCIVPLRLNLPRA